MDTCDAVPLLSHFTLQVVGAITGDVICTVDADGSWYLQDLKVAIQSVSGIPTHEQRLLQVGGKPIANEDRHLSEILKCQHDWSIAPKVSIGLVRADAERTAALEHLAIGGSLTQLKESYRGDPEVVLTAVQNNGSAFRHASDRLRSDKDFLLAAIERSCDVLCYVSDEWRWNRDFVLEAIHRNGTVPRQALWHEALVHFRGWHMLTVREGS